MKTIRKKCSTIIQRTADGLRNIVRSTSNTPTPNNSTDASSSEMYDSGVSPERLAASLAGVSGTKGHPGGGDAGGGSRRRVRQKRAPQSRARKRQMRSYARYVRALMRTIHPNRRLSKAAIACMDSFLADMQIRLSEEARRLCRLAGRRTLKAVDVRAAVHLLLPGELAVHAKREADVALKLLAAKSASERTRARSLP